MDESGRSIDNNMYRVFLRHKKENGVVVAHQPPKLVVQVQSLVLLIGNSSAYIIYYII